MSRLIDLTDKRFGRLVAQKLVYKQDKCHGTYWECICDCGKIHVVSGIHLRHGHTKSCGCLKKELLCLKKGEASFNALYYQYKCQAKKRNFVFVLTREFFYEITQQNCFYCGKKPVQCGSRTQRRFGDYLYNGIDRVDNSKGYEKDNCVPCCKWCNIMKRDKSMSEFLKHIQLIAGKHLAQKCLVELE